MQVAKYIYVANNNPMLTNTQVANVTQAAKNRTRRDSAVPVLGNLEELLNTLESRLGAVEGKTSTFESKMSTLEGTVATIGNFFSGCRPDSCRQGLGPWVRSGLGF